MKYFVLFLVACLISVSFNTSEQNPMTDCTWMVSLGSSSDGVLGDYMFFENNTFAVFVTLPKRTHPSLQKKLTSEISMKGLYEMTEENKFNLKVYSSGLTDEGGVIPTEMKNKEKRAIAEKLYKDISGKDLLGTVEGIIDNKTITLEIEKKKQYFVVWSNGQVEG